MLIHYIKVAIRNLVSQAGISFINIFGLTTGMACAILIFLWVNHQLSYDKNQLNRSRIFRLETETWVVLPPFLRETAAVFPEVEQAVRFYFWYDPIIRYHENQFTVSDCALVDSNVFRVFNFDFLVGNPETALNAPQSVVLTRSVAQKLFGKENPMGKVLLMDNQYEYTVTGVVDDITDLHLEIDVFIPVSDMTGRPGNKDFLVSRNYNFPIYLLVHPETDVPTLVNKIDTRAREEDNYSGAPLLLRPFEDIYFAKNLQHESNTKHGNAGLVILFSVIALLILIIACINFINLSLAKTAVREKEIAVRKVSGAGKKIIMMQYLGETFLIVLIAFLFSMILTKFLLPGFNYITGEEIIPDFKNSRFIAIFLSILIFSVVTSGLLPSFYVSSLSPVKIFKGRSGAEMKSHSFSKILITFQFVVSIILIILAITVLQQLRYMQEADLGIDISRVITFTLHGEKFQGNSGENLSSKQAFKEQLLNNPLVRGVSFVHQVPGSITNTWTLSIDENDESGIPFKVIVADPGFVDLMDLEIIDGRNFSFNRQTDMGLKFIINQEAVKQLQLDSPPGSTLQSGMIEIIGVVRDFHFNSMHSKIEPMAIQWSSWAEKACVKVAATNIPESIEYIESVFHDFCPGYVFEYDFLNESFAGQYHAEQRLGRILTCFVLIAICLSCLGLFALSSFVAQQKTRETGIRKAFGSTMPGIVFLITGRFILWVVIATIISWPVAWIILQKWLENYPYHITLSFTVFLGSGLLAVVVALITTGVQSLRAALANPADSLRYE
jgi:putative ABC transport system permease protein